MNINEKLFNEFPPITTEQWENIIVKDLKGADYDKKLVWKTDEGFNVRPYYRAEDLDRIAYLDSLPDQFPYIRGYKTKGNDWQIVQEITDETPAIANQNAIHAVQKGANVIAFSAKNITTPDQLKTLLNGLDLTQIGIQFNHSTAYIPLVKMLIDFVNANQYDKAKVHCAIDFDPISFYLKTGKHYSNKENDFHEMSVLLDLLKDFPNFKIVNVNGLIMHNAGSTLVQEVGYGLAIANEYLAYAQENGLSIAQLASKMQFTLSVGSNYFMEIAKLRAVRLLWSTIVAEYKPTCPCAYHLHINTVSSTWNKTIYDPYINMLRSTTEGMSAAVGGSDSITLKPFDVAYKADDEFSRRISRNVQVILKEESYFNKVADPAAGSYYIENLTNSIAEQAWLLFQHVDKEGGMLNVIASQEVKNEIEKSCAKRDLDIATRKYILLGTNQYPNINEVMLEKIDKLESDTQTAGLKEYRGAFAFEQIRLATERFAQKKSRPKVFLLKIGNLAMRQARAGFITNFFGCAGYEIIDNAGFNTVKEGVEAAQSVHADIVVLCSSDEEYATLGVEAARMVKNTLKSQFVIAGNPIDSLEILKNAGTDDFIHARVNVLETLRKYNDLLLQ